MEINKVVIIGALKNKNRNGNTIIKRPVIDIEILQKNSEGGLSFNVVPVILTNNAIARSLPGLQYGEIFLIYGRLRIDCKGELYVEADQLLRYMNVNRTDDDLENKIELITIGSNINIAEVSGTVHSIHGKNLEIKASREDSLERGSLTREDIFPICLDKERKLSIGDKVICLGKLDNNKMHGTCRKIEDE